MYAGYSANKPSTQRQQHPLQLAPKANRRLYLILINQRQHSTRPLGTESNRVRISAAIRMEMDGWTGEGNKEKNVEILQQIQGQHYARLPMMYSQRGISPSGISFSRNHSIGNLDSEKGAIQELRRSSGHDGSPNTTFTSICDILSKTRLPETKTLQSPAFMHRYSAYKTTEIRIEPQSKSKTILSCSMAPGARDVAKFYNHRPRPLINPFLSPPEAEA